MFGAAPPASRGLSASTAASSRGRTAGSDALSARLFERPPCWGRFRRLPRVSENPGWAVLAFLAFAALGVTAALWTYPSVADAARGEARVFNACLVVGLDAATGCVRVQLLHAPRATQCVYPRDAAQGGAAARLRFVEAHPVGLELPCYYPQPQDADVPLAIEFEGTPSVALAYVSLVVLLLPLLVCCYSSYRSLGPLLPPKLSRVEDEVLPWIVRATESGADAATHAAEGRLDAGMTDLRDQLSYEKQRRLALEANFEREKQERLEQAERGRVDVEGAIANVQNRAEDADQAAQAAVAALLAKKERKKKRAKSRQQSRM